MGTVLNSQVVIILEGIVRVLRAPKPPLSTIRAGGVEYREITSAALESAADLSGHHDWLVSGWRQVIGIRFYPFDLGEALWRRIGNHHAVLAVPALHAIEIRWGRGDARIRPTSDYIPSDFRVFESIDGTLAVSVTAEYLGFTMRLAYDGVISE